ncbi:MAG: secretin N-terminal domain-containing protein [Candidatus Tritonobacter lacicola]|nr:secretin N-terminal domain-containing protein [Candidatus Tritonobacter lacicola]
MRFITLATAAAAIALLAAPTAGHGQGAKGPPDPMEEELINIDFSNVDIRLVIKLVSDLTGRNYLIHDAIRGPVTIISPTRIPVSELEKVLDSILQVRGFAAVPSGNITKILPKTDAGQSTIDTRLGDELDTIPAYDELITQLIPLEYADAEEIRRIVDPLKSKGSSLQIYAPTNTIILTEVAANIKRLVSIIEELDIPGGEATITVVPLEWASASIMASEIMQVVLEGKIPTGKRRPPTKGTRRAEAVKIISDERTNSLIIVATPKQTEGILNLIEKLDTSTPAGKTRINVYRLKYAKAEDLATVLTNLTSKKKLGPTESPVIITSYKNTNALVVDASPQDYILIEKIINDLDIARDQVLVELILAEVNLAKSLDMGINANTITSILTAEEFTDTSLFWGGQAFDNALNNMFVEGDTGNFRTRAMPFAPAGRGGKYGFMFRDDDRDWMNFAVLLDLLQADRDFNILSAPQVLTSDNEEVEFKVVRNIPFPTSNIISTETQAIGGELQNFDYRDVGVEMKITPQISPDRTVTLEIHQKIDNVTGSVEVTGVGLAAPETLKRETKTTISVRDKDVVIMSGIISDRKTEVVTKVPILGDMPYFGAMFRSKRSNWDKINLLIFIRPHIITSPDELLAVTNLLRERSEDFIQEGYGQPPRSLDLFLEKLEREPTEKPPKVMELFYDADKG